MVDFRVDDGFPHHPKALGLSHESVGVWVLIGCWCSRYLTDGYIPDTAVRDITRRPRVLTELADHQLLVRVTGGWQMVDWSQWQRTRAQVEGQRERARKRIEKWRREHGRTDDQ